MLRFLTTMLSLWDLCAVCKYDIFPWRLNSWTFRMRNHDPALISNSFWVWLAQIFLKQSPLKIHKNNKNNTKKIVIGENSNSKANHSFAPLLSTNKIPAIQQGTPTADRSVLSALAQRALWLEFDCLAGSAQWRGLKIEILSYIQKVIENRN